MDIPDGSPYINEIEFQPPSPSSNHHFTFPHTPSYNGSYNNSPYSGHSELSFAQENDSFAYFDEDPSAIAVNDYDPTEFDNPHASSLLMFNDSEFISAYNPVSSISVTTMDASNRTSYDYSSPSSNGGGDSGAENDQRRSRASSTSSNLQPSPRMQVTQSFESMTFHSPHWGTEPLPSLTREISSHPMSPQKPPSPPRLLMPDASPALASVRGLPTINAPDGDGGIGPQLHIVPATPVGGSGAGAPFQGSLETLHQGEYPSLPTLFSKRRKNIDLLI